MASAPQLALRSLDAGWNRARWEDLPDDGNRYEVIGGVLYMSTAPSYFHQWIIRQLFLALYAQFDSLGIGQTIWSPIGVFMPGCDPVQPDVLVIRTEAYGMVHGRRVEGVPALLVEVLSPSNPEADTHIKRVAYARAGVPEYWIIRPAARDAVVYSRTDAALGDYARSQPVEADGALVSPTLPVRIAIADLFAGALDTTL